MCNECYILEVEKKSKTDEQCPHYYACRRAIIIGKTEGHQEAYKEALEILNRNNDAE